MASIIVENRVCEACGKDVRAGSLFCYHCGASVEPKHEAVDASDKKENISQIQFPENARSNGGNSGELKPEKIKIKSRALIIENTKAEKIPEKPVENIEEIPVGKTGIHEQVELKTAASLRRKSKIIQRKKVEVVWEEYENAPGGWFIIVALILAGLAAGIIYLAMYLK